MKDFGAYERLTMAEGYNRRERERERDWSLLSNWKMIIQANDYTSSNYRE